MADEAEAQPAQPADAAHAADLDGATHTDESKTPVAALRTLGKGDPAAERWLVLSESLAAREPIPIDVRVAQQVRDAAHGDCAVAEAVEAARTAELASVVVDMRNKHLGKYGHATFVQWAMNAVSMWFYFHAGTKPDQTETRLRAAFDAICNLLAPEDDWHQTQIGLVFLRHLVLTSTGFDGDPWLDTPAAPAAPATPPTGPDGKREASPPPKRARHDDCLHQE